MARSSRRRYGYGVLGGTFDRFHVGHEDLLNAAFGAAERVGIGVTTPRFLAAHPKSGGGRIEPYSRRVARVRRFLRVAHPGRKFQVVPLDDSVGGALDARVDVIIVSSDTISGARRINTLRRRRRLPTAAVVGVPLRLGEDLLPVHSSRIRSGDVTRLGKRRTPLRIGLTGAETSVEAKLVLGRFNARLPGVRVRLKRSKAVSRRGSSDHTRGPAQARARARAALRLGEIGIGVARSPSRRVWVAAATEWGGRSDSGPASRELSAAFDRALRALRRRAA